MSIRLVFRPKTGWSNEAKSVPITYRELELLCLIGQGNDYKEAAEILGLTYPTVKNYMHKMAKKLGAKNMANAIVIALQAGMIRIEIAPDDWPFDDQGKRIGPDPDWVKRMRDEKG
jgi:DNA-binding CsgD family transcriptional regulator